MVGGLNRVDVEPKEAERRMRGREGAAAAAGPGERVCTGASRGDVDANAALDRFEWTSPATERAPGPGVEYLQRAEACDGLELKAEMPRAEPTASLSLTVTSYAPGPGVSARSVE